MEKLFHILYIDSDLLNAAQLLEYFNPPRFMSPELLEKRNKKLGLTQQYQFVFIHCSDFKQAIKTLIAHNVDPLAQQQKLPKIDTIFFEVKGRLSEDKYTWLDFLQDISSMGTQRLGLTSGFLSFGAQAGESVKEQLMYYGVRCFLKKPFMMQQLQEYLMAYLTTLRGSSVFYIEERKENLERGKITRRILRFNDPAGKYKGVPLHSLEDEYKDDTATSELLTVTSDLPTDESEAELGEVISNKLRE
jgi:hypothetical protein